MSRPINHEALLTHWLLENEYERVEARGGEQYSLSQLSRDFAIREATVRKYARAHDWRRRLKEHLEARREQVLRMATVQDDFDEAEVRTRHARVAKSMMMMALRRINSIKKPEEELTVGQALELLKFALPHERLAVGIDGAGFSPPPGTDAREWYEDRAEMRRAAVRLAQRINSDQKLLPSPSSPDADEAPPEVG